MADHSKDKRDIESEKCAANLRSVLRFREMRLNQLSDRTGISRRTLESYTSGRVSLLDAKAGTVLRVAKELNVDINILLGVEPIEAFYKREESLLRRRRRRMPLESDNSELLKRSKNQSDVVEYYYKSVDKE